jgi:glycosyltransferase involved in cell wall biosynthesis
MRVGIDAHTVGRRQTGNERFTVELTNALAARGDVEVLAYLDPGVEWPAVGEAPAVRRLRARQPQLRIPFELPIRARRDRLDVLQVAYIAPPVLGTPLVTVVHDISFEDLPEMYSSATRWRLKLGVRRAVAQSAAVVTGSRFTRERLIDVYGLDPERVHCITYGVGDEWRPMAPAEAGPLLREVALPGKFVLAVGSGAPRKNARRLIDAVRAVRADALPDLELVFAGPLDIAADEPWIRRLGYVEDKTLRALYSSADVVAYVSLYEGFGLPVLEALACGAVVVASSTTAVADATGEAAVTVDPSTVDSIAAGLHRGLTDEALRTELRTRARDHVSRFSWQTCAREMVGLYQQLRERGPG